MQKLNLKIGIVLLIVFLSVLAVAQPKGRPRSRSMSSPMMRSAGSSGGFGHTAGMILKYKEKLELTDKQVEQLQALRKENKGQFQAKAQAVKDNRDSLKQAMESGASETEIRAIAADIGKAIGEQAVLSVSTKKKIDAILTDEQKAELKNLVAQSKKEKQKTTKSQKDTKTVKPARCTGAAFSRIDTDGDGSISSEEFNAHMQRMRDRGGERPRRSPRRRKKGY